MICKTTTNLSSYSKTVTMKTEIKIREKTISILMSTVLLCFAFFAKSQTVCSDNINTVYGFSVTGGVYPINVNTGVVGTAIGTIYDGVRPDSNANAFGFNSVNNKFYGFYRCAAAVAPLSEFISYDPLTNTTSVLATPPFGTTTKIRSGCVNNTGSGYYCIDIVGATPSLWYYNIPGNTWTKITSSFKKNGVTDTTAVFQSLNSGDMAFDGAGNLWMVISKSTQYAMYKITNPVPTTVQTSVNVKEIIPPKPTPTRTGTAPNQVSFTGLAFNANGEAYLTTGSGTGAANNQLYKMTSAASGVVYVGALSTPLLGSGDDLTSCIFTYVLPVRWLGFNAELTKQSGVYLTWNVVEDNTVKQYYVERSTDANRWERLSAVKRKGAPDLPNIQYNYTDYNYLPGRTYYHIVAEDMYGKTRTSEVRQVVATDQNFAISPVPAKDKLTIKQKNARTSQVDIYDKYGRLLLSTELIYPNETVDISRLSEGNYFLKLSIDGIETAHSSFIKL